MKTLKQLIKETEDKSVFHITWAFLWRGVVLYLATAFAIGIAFGLLSIMFE